MSFDLRLAVTGDLREHLSHQESLLLGGLHKAAALGGEAVKERWRAGLRAGGLGDKLPKTVRNTVYPRRPVSAAPAATVWTRAPHILRVHAEGGTFSRSGGQVNYWVPTENTPRRGNRRMTPEEVSARYGKLMVLPAKTPGGPRVAIVRAIAGKSGGWRKASAGRRRQKRAVEVVPMFIVIRQFTLQRAYDFDTIEAQAQRDWPDIASRALAQSFSNEPPEGI